MQITMNGETNADGYLILKIPMKLKNTTFKLTITAQETSTSEKYLTQTDLLARSQILFGNACLTNSVCIFEAELLVQTLPSRAW